MADCADWSDRYAQTGLTGQGDFAKNTNWTLPLRSSRRDDRNAYVERTICSSDERVIASERFDIGSDRSDRSKLYSPSLELYFDAGFVWN